MALGSTDDIEAASNVAITEEVGARCHKPFPSK